MKEHPILNFSGSDSIARFYAWLVILGGGAIPIPYYLYLYGNLKFLLVVCIAFIAVLLGLRYSIVVTRSRVVITRRWFSIPYRRYRAPVVEDVYFGGDFGLAEGAFGVIVKMGDKEVHIGSSRTMYVLHDALLALTPRRVCRTKQASP